MLEQITMKLKQACRDAQFVSLTLDVWTDRRMRAFLAVTMHTISESDDVFKNYLLAFQPLSGNNELCHEQVSCNHFQDHIRAKICAINSKKS